MVLFFLSPWLVLFFTHRQYLLCPWHLNVRCKFLQMSPQPTMHVLFYDLLSDISPPIWHILSQKLNIFAPKHHETYNGTENKRKMSVSWQKIVRQKHTLKLWTRSLHVMILLIYACLFTWATIADLFSVAPVTQSPTHHSYGAYTQNPCYKAEKKEIQSMQFVCLDPHFCCIYNLYFYSMTI